MLKKFKKLKFILVILLIWMAFCYPVFIGKTPFPADYQVNFFTPWTSYPGMKGPVKNNAQPDIVGQIYPWRYYSIQELKQGRIPFWNPYSFAGTPHLANYQSAVFFPLNILFFLPIEFIDAWSVLVVLQPLLAGLFMYLLLRQLKISEMGSLISSFSFMFCGFGVTWLGYATLGYAILPIPLALYLILRYASSRRVIWLVLLAMTFPFSFFAGHFQTSIYFALVVFGFVLYNLFFGKDKKIYLIAFIFSIAGVLLTMPQVLPSIEFYSNAVRSEIFAKIEAIPIQYLPTVIAPDFFGNPVTRNDWYGHYAEWSSYAGVIPLGLALFTVLFRRNFLTVFFLSLAIFSLVLSLDTPLIDMIARLQIPVLSTSASSRIIVLFSFSVAVLAGFGFDALVKAKKLQLYKWIIILSIIFIILLALGFGIIDDNIKFSIAIKNSLLPVLFLLLSISSFILFRFKKTKIKNLVLMIIVVLVGFEMLRFASKWQNFDNAKNVFVNLPVTDFLSSKPNHERVIGFNSAEISAYYKIPVLTGYDPLYIEDYGKFIKYVESGELKSPDRSAVLFDNRGIYAKEGIDFLGVKYIAHKYLDFDKPWAFPLEEYSRGSLVKVFDDGKYQVFENKNAFDRAFLLPGEKTTLDSIDSFRSLNGKEIPENAEILEYRQDFVRVKVNTNEKATLVLTDNYYPGWRVSVNGMDEKIHRINKTFRGVVVPRGESIVEFSYLPKSFLYGVYLFFIGALIMMSYIIVSRLTKSK